MCCPSRLSCSSLLVSSRLVSSRVRPVMLVHVVYVFVLLTPLTPLHVLYASSCLYPASYSFLPYYPLNGSPPYTFRPIRLIPIIRVFGVFECLTNPEQFEHFDLFEVLECLPPHALQRVKLNFFNTCSGDSLTLSTGSKRLTCLESLEELEELGEFEGVEGFRVHITP